MGSARIYKTEAIILKRKNVGEADRILTIFTKEYGKMSVLAKGIRRITSRRSPHVEVFGHSLILLHKGKTWDVVSETHQLDAFQQLRKNLSLIGFGYAVCELVDRLLPEKQEHRDIFYLLLEALRVLESGQWNDKKNEEFCAELLRRLGFLSQEQPISPDDLYPFVERLIEKRLYVRRLLTKLN